MTCRRTDQSVATGASTYLDELVEQVGTYRAIIESYLDRFVTPGAQGGHGRTKMNGSRVVRVVFCCVGRPQNDETCIDRCRRRVIS